MLIAKTAFNPLSMDLPAVEPVNEEDMPGYLKDIAPYLRLIGLSAELPDSLRKDTISIIPDSIR